MKVLRDVTFEFKCPSCLGLDYILDKVIDKSKPSYTHYIPYLYFMSCEVCNYVNKQISKDEYLNKGGLLS